MVWTHSATRTTQPGRSPRVWPSAKSGVRGLSGSSRWVGMLVREMKLPSMSVRVMG